MHLSTIPEEDNWTSLVEGRECRRPLSKSTMSLLFRLFVLVPIYRQTRLFSSSAMIHSPSHEGEDGLTNKASLAQLEERGSHNPKVVSSILTTRSFFFSTNTPLHIQLPPLLIYFSLDVPVARRVLH